MRKRILTKQVAVVLSEDTYQQIIEVTDNLEIPVSQFIRNIVEKELTKSNKEVHKDE